MNEKRTRQLILTCFLGSIVASAIMVIAAIFVYHWQYIKPIQCETGIIPCAISNTSPNPLDGWTEECYEWNITEKYEVVDPSKDCVRICGLKTDCQQVGGSMYINCYIEVGDSACYFECTNTTKPYLRFYNETNCVKKILTKEVTP